jgi:hypothetical protein
MHSFWLGAYGHRQASRCFSFPNRCRSYSGTRAASSCSQSLTLLLHVRHNFRAEDRLHFVEENSEDVAMYIPT